MLPDGTGLTRLTLRVRDRDAQIGFYRDRLGLSVVDDRPDRVTLTPAGRQFHLILQLAPEAPRRPHPSVGLYHLALLLPDRPSLAALFDHLRNAPVHWDGASDHGVSEALYLRDAEGNGVELYRDRPRADWSRIGDEVSMVTEHLDLEDLLAQSPGPAPLSHDTRLGHVHLHAGDLQASGAFYQGLGLRVTQSSYPGALFLAAGDYHHHVGLNAWARGRTAPPGSTGLVGFSLGVPAAEWEDVVGRVGAKGSEEGGRVTVRDPDGHAVGFERR